jgi:hypothetical protein
MRSFGIKIAGNIWCLPVVSRCLLVVGTLRSSQRFFVAGGKQNQVRNFLRVRHQ